MKTEIISINDNSGSMAGMTAIAAQRGFNSFLREQKTVPGEARMTTVLFNSPDNYKVLYQGVPLDQVHEMASYPCKGMTGLYDAIGRTLEEQGARIAREGWAEKVIVTITTDGGENQSRKFSAEKIAEMTQHCEKHGWSFIFLAANQDAVLSAKTIGLQPSSAMSFQATAAGVAGAYGSSSAVTRSLRTAP